MGYLFTPGAERAIAAAARWTRDGAGDVLPIAPVEMLLGLLAEGECRAAKLLVEHGVDEAAVRRRWPGVDRDADAELPTAAMRGLSYDVEERLRGACERLDESLRSFQFATEHILLGLALADDDVGAWLREQGLDAGAIESVWAKLYGGERGPIAVDLEPIPLAEGSVEHVVQSTVTRVASDAANNTNSIQIATLRILDAEANRAGEALRVVEDYVRFVLDDAALVRQTKEMRHELTAALAGIPMPERLAARDTTHDVGTSISTSGEMTRRDPADVAAANVRRLQESLRSLEEFAKLIDPAIATRCEALRYRSYVLQQSIGGASPVHGQVERPRIDAARLYVLLDGRNDAAAFDFLATSLVAAGVDVLQLRDKKLDDRTLLDRARRLREITRGSRTLCIMNDRADLAVLADADGLHVGQDELTVAEARRIVGPKRLVGVSTHSIDQARQAVADGADYLGVGPVFPSTTKSFAHFPGLELVKAVAAEIRLPGFAIGGITLENVEEVRRAGLNRIAIGGAIVDAADPAAAVRALHSRLASPAK